MDVPAEEFDQNDSSAVVEKTIETMQNLQLCVDPIHKHSFAPVSFLISGPMRICAGCNQRLHSVLGIGPAPQVVRCVACYSYAHRSCAFSTDKSIWVEACPVNSAIVDKVEAKASGNDASEENVLEESGVLLSTQTEAPVSQRLEDSLVHVQEEDENTPASDDILDSSGVSNALGDSFEDMTPPWSRSPESSLGDSLVEPSGSATHEERDDYVMEGVPPVEAPVIVSDEVRREIGENESDENIVHVQQEETISVVDTDVTESVNDMSPFTQVRKIPASSLLPPAPYDDFEEAPKSPLLASKHENDEIVMVWTPEGPPRHWACEESLENLPKMTSLGIDEAEAQEQLEEEEGTEEPLHYENHPFASVSRVLQDSVLAYFRQSPQKDGDTEEPHECSHSVEGLSPNTVENGTAKTVVDVKSLLTEVQPSPKEQDRPLTRLASGTLDVVKTTAQARRKLGMVSVAGGIAGGAAGLLVAGPAGAVIGAKLFQTAGVLGVIIESSVGVGVVVASVAAASFAAQQIQQQGEKRVLTLGEGDSRKVLLVRPNVTIDPIWEEICADAIKSSPSMNRKSFGMIPTSSAWQADIAKRERSRRDTDIVETDEYEIPTEDKVLLLVSRSLNDKFSLPGHVYRCLIIEHRERSQKRKNDEQNKRDRDSSGLSENTRTQENAGCAEFESEKEEKDQRERRKDCHAVIKHVTATLLEVRPGFASSRKITEMSATAVEGLVFGELYESVFEEIVQETNTADENLFQKILSFEGSQVSTDRGSPLPWREGVSEIAVETLRTLPDAHAAVDKLQICVQFVEHISMHFSSRGRSDTRETPVINADSLLKMVCQHIIAAKIPRIHAEICFLEEFARDEHLLRGREGYALVTLQASLHFLNASTDIENDIFRQDDEHVEIEESAEALRDESSQTMGNGINFT